MDFEKYKLQEFNKTKLQVLRGRKQVQRLKPPFLRGPIPLGWLQRAMRLSGSAICIGIILWYLRGLKKSSVFKIGIQDIANLISSSWLTAKRGLMALEKERLISVDRHQGRKHIIEIHETDNEDSQRD